MNKIKKSLNEDKQLIMTYIKINYFFKKVNLQMIIT